MKKYLIAISLILGSVIVIHAALPASDNFNRADESPMGAPWIAPDGVAGSKLSISSNHVICPAGATLGYMYWNTDTPGNDQVVSAIIGGATINAVFNGVAARIQNDGTQSGYLYGNILGTYKIQKLASGTRTDINGSCSGTPTASDVAQLSITGSNLTGTINGGSTCTGTDSTFSSGLGGLYCYGALGTATLDDFTLDNVGGGSPPLPMKICFHFGLVCH